MANISTDDNTLRAQPDSMMLSTIPTILTARATTAARTATAVDGLSTIRAPRRQSTHHQRQRSIPPSSIQAQEAQPTGPAAEAASLHRRNGIASLTQVSTTTANYGTTDTTAMATQHHLLRQLLQQQQHQQQGAQARPGLSQIPYDPGPDSQPTCHPDDVLLSSSAPSPFAEFRFGDGSAGVEDLAIRRRSLADFPVTSAPPGDFDFLIGTDNSTLSTVFPHPSGLGWTSDDEAMINAYRASRRVSNGIADRVLKFENMAAATCATQKPRTPERKVDSSKFLDLTDNVTHN